MLSQEKTPGRTEMHREQPRYTSVFPTETKLDLEKQRETDEPTSEAGNCEACMNQPADGPLSRL